MATNLIVTAFNEAGGNRAERSSNPLPVNEVEEPSEQLPDEIVDDGETTISPSASQNGKPRIVATPFFSIISDYEFVYETLRFVPSTTMSPLAGIETRLHMARGSVVSFLEDGTRVNEQVYRSSDGVLEMEIGKGSDGSPQWALIIPKNVKEGDRWEHKYEGFTNVFECLHVSQWTSPPENFTEMSGNTLVEIEMRKFAEGMKGPYEAYQWTFVKPVGLVVEKYFVPTASSDGGRLSHIKTDTLKEIRVADTSHSKTISSPQTASQSSTTPTSVITDGKGDKYDQMEKRMLRNLQSAGTLTDDSKNSVRRLMDAYRKYDN